ncbi:WD40-repeat-containing domain protein [Crucibulum laeve]|uniref:WD40-repeat-containing domain protein n=1 Tax=Crucibulum laeve TaxID=68775 RepID=A0A5C3MEI1_9AGAR|nr:WD40-repeat-containing domain protein [Crucibulum laeve]
MNLARHSISSTNPIHVLDARFDPDCKIFTAATPAGFAVYRASPLKLIRKRELTGGTLAAVVPLHTSNLLFLVGGGRSPLYPPNKVVLWDDALGKEVAELEFREKVRGLACRRGWLAVALRRRVVVFEVGEQVTRYGEWDTCDNPQGLLAMATAPYSTLLAIAGRQMGHVQMVHLPRCPLPMFSGPPPSSPPLKPPPYPTKPHVSIIAAHTTALTTLSLPPSGKLLATTSLRGTLIRIWDSWTGKLIKELRRGTDKAEIYGVAFRPDEQEVCVWSDKGTVHVFHIEVSNRQSSLSGLAPFIPLPKYFDSEWSYAQYRIPVQSSHISLSSTTRSSIVDAPDEERCVVGWVDVSADNSTPSHTTPPKYQLVALTYMGGWYRLSLPDPEQSAKMASSPSLVSGTSASPPKSMPAVPRTSSGSSTVGRVEKGKERDREKKAKVTTQCTLQEFRRFGRWDGWG